MIELTPEMRECLKGSEELFKRNPLKLMNKITTVLKTKGQEYLHAEGFTEVQMWYGAVLGNLDLEGTNIITLAHRARMTKQAISKLVKDLHQKGFVSLESDDHDKRAVKVFFTSDGIRLLSFMRKFSQETADLLRDKIGAADYEKFVDILLMIDEAAH